ncbi:DHA2 family multidrug resistance protein-like MFS transporter [Trueperella bonasi]|uniref:DHA2 family multidrug resistance protein-like MFS transporter n=1 Tax=Trueperella bonasi TaxID=312286 RepID=A0ABT9NH94_9ACTO|nr:MFS transporter [Trueperella bonasi]MDP9806163.1 DHA2 family multidrug resistance protein-like MFS transporter [Trueperella bonasi]
MTEVREYHGTKTDLAALVISVLTFWLLGQSMLNVGLTVGNDLGMAQGLTNLAVSMGSLVCGMLIVMWGSLGDMFGRLKMVRIGLLLNIVGSLLLVLAAGGPAIAGAMVLTGRIFHGLAGGAVTPAALALVNSYWHGDKRARAISYVSMGTFGGMAGASIVGGAIAGSPLTWRGIFAISVVLSILALFMLRKTPDVAPLAGSGKKLDVIGIVTLALAMLSLQLYITQGPALGWTSPAALGIAAVLVVSIIVFVRHELTSNDPLIDFAVFKNSTFAGAITANFLVTTTAGMITVALWVMQGSDQGYDATRASYLTIGYLVCVLAFITTGEKLMKSKGYRIPMLAGAVLVALSVVLLMFTNLMVSQYVVVAVVAFSIYGVGLALFATPTTTAALNSLPQDIVGAGSGILKMASSLGSAIGLAISSTVFTTFAQRGTGSEIVGRIIEYTGTQENLAVRQAGTIALFTLLVGAIVAIIAVWFLIPSRKEQFGESAD